MNQLTYTQSPGNQSTELGAEGPQNPHLPLRRLATTLFRGKALLMVTTLIGATLAAGVCLIKPNEYVSSAKFVIRDGAERVDVRLTSDDSAPRRPDLGMLARAPLLLGDPELARRTVQRIGISRICAPYRPLAEPNTMRAWVYEMQSKLHDFDVQNLSLDDAVEYFLGGLTISTIRRTDLLMVQYAANDSELAREVLTAYVEEAKKFHIEIYNEASVLEQVSADHGDAKKAHQSVRSSLESFLAGLHLTNFTAELERYQNESATARLEVRELEEGIVPSLELAIERERATLKHTAKTRVSKTVERHVNPKIAELTRMVAQNQAALHEMELRFKQPDAVEVLRAKKRLQLAMDDVAREKPFTETTRVENVPNEVYASTQVRLATAERELSLAAARLKIVGKRAHKLTERSQLLARHEVDHQQLTQALANALDVLAASEHRLARARNKQLLSERHLGSLHLISKPSDLPVKQGPQRAKLFMFGLIAGLGAGIAFLTFRAITDNTIRTPEELEALVGLRVLATVPQLERKHIARHRNRLLSGC